MTWKAEDGVPMCIALAKDGANWNPSVFNLATHVFARVTESLAMEGTEVNTLLFGTITPAVHIKVGQLNCLYLKIDQCCVTTHPALNIILSRHYSQLYESVDFVNPMSDSMLFRKRGINAEDGPEPVRGLLAMSKLPHSAITQQHHLHFNITEACQTIDRNRLSYLLEVLSVPSDATQAFASGLFMWGALVGDAMFERVRESGLFGSRSSAQFAAIAKQISVEAKSLQNLHTEDYRSIFELDVLVNRGVGKVDWEKEQENRQHPKVATVDACEVRRTAYLVFRKALEQGRRPVSMSWDEFWSARWEWTAAGAVHSNAPGDSKYIFKEVNEMKNKFITMSAMPKLPLSHFLQREPGIDGWASVKYEWGKQRAIYGTDLTSYVLSNFAMYACESVLPSAFPVGPDADEANVAARVGGVLNNRMPLCIDFEDFNSQHSVEAMQAVLDAYSDVFDHLLTVEQKYALRWTAQSIGKTSITNNIANCGTYSTKGTMLSGWRLTTMMNSVLNYVYTTHLLGRDRDDTPSVHNGDDVLLGVKNMRVAQEMNRRAQRVGIRLQPSKCAFAGIAEFLRVDRIRGSGGQYLTRSVATIVHSRVESKPKPNVKDLIEAMETRLADLHQRGASIRKIARIREVYYHKLAGIFKSEVDTMYAIKSIHRVNGGISQDMYAAVDREVLNVVNLEKSSVPELPKLPGIHDYADYVAKVLPIESKVKKMCEKLTKSTQDSVSMYFTTAVLADCTSVQDRLNMKKIYKAHKGEIKVSQYGKAVLTGYGMELLRSRLRPGALRTLLTRSENPIELLSLVV
ncbi:RNA dependent RNA polymerase [Red clover powdery mildew-associated totivirus 3]|uniref:RNA-directed RNA polymerase n=1 Tax=Red clover powdery mildew-associated totivirus 3 TaxID=1714364 RepID=A0A0S3Q2C1_9VIRU|nr:RNA dependent RNA polymerase [Red clover powdery mildew-associated totivirus 3]BAT62482.1 RNA dependent RNA polymerase [Red clover powdery mildew-associated totivirus 3]